MKQGFHYYTVNIKTTEYLDENGAFELQDHIGEFFDTDAEVLVAHEDSIWQ